MVQGSRQVMDIVEFGKGSSIVKLQTTVSAAGEDIFVDMQQVPVGYVRVIQNASMTPDSNLTAAENITPFVCDQTMSPSVSPLLPTGRIDQAKTGVALGQSWSVGAGNPFSMLGEPVAFIAVLGPGQFLRFATNGTNPNPGDFANIQVFYSDVPIC
jgi:hypothetical protein